MPPDPKYKRPQNQRLLSTVSSMKSKKSKKSSKRSKDKKTKEVSSGSIKSNTSNNPDPRLSEESPPEQDLRKIIQGIIHKKQQEDLRESLLRKGEKKQKHRKMKTVTTRKVTVIKIPQQKSTPTDTAAEPSPKENPSLKTPMKRKRCNRCKKYGHINRLCPFNPNNLCLIPLPPDVVTLDED